ncbi:aldo-keto reductase protein [Rutstroemia sp. NJR-2017a BBW]|nr:aldo-keto reductase protein [Rutstroemia sp. NJR-2017a BBW]
MSSFTKPPTPASLQASINSTKVEYVQLGSSGLRVSSPILGVMAMGSKKWNVVVMEEEESLQVLKAAWERGLTTWDTANVYSSGASEEIVGAALKKLDIPRRKINILTKVFGTVPEEEGFNNWHYEDTMAQTRDYVNQGGLSRGAIFRAVDASLKRLGTDYIDVLQIHRYDPTVSPEETMKALHDLVQSGKVNYIGASSMWTYQFARMQFIAEKNGWTKFVSMQNFYNLIYREEEREMIKFCKETGVALIPYGVLGNSLLAKPLNVESTRSNLAKMVNRGVTDADATIIKRTQEVAEKKQCKMSQVAAAWVKGKGCIPIIGLGSTSIERLEDACALKDIKLTEEEVKYLEEPYIPKPVNRHE